MKRRPKQKTLWVGLDQGGRVHATWYRGCALSFQTWRRAIKGMGLRLARCEFGTLR